MISSTTTTKNYSCRFSVRTDDTILTIWYEVSAYDHVKHTSDLKTFAEGNYAKAVTYYRDQCATFEKLYGKEGF